jgi:hypothetical protein
LDLRARWPARLAHHLEVGLQTPFVAIDRRSERYPLIATVYWREPEVHVIGETQLELGHRASASVGVSLAMMRPIGRAGVQESTAQTGTIAVVAYDPAAAFSTRAPVVGAKAELATCGAAATVFGFAGRLGSERGTDALRSSFPNFAILPGYAADDAVEDATFHWYGARLSFSGYHLHALVEAIASRESFLRRYGAYGQFSVELPLRAPDAWFHTLELLGRYELYRLRGAKRVRASGEALRSPAAHRAVTWDFSATTAALIAVAYRDLLRLRLEYYWIAEDNGVPGLSIDDDPFANNELLAQLELRF